MSKIKVLLGILPHTAVGLKKAGNVILGLRDFAFFVRKTRIEDILKRDISAPEIPCWERKKKTEAWCCPEGSLSHRGGFHTLLHC